MDIFDLFQTLELPKGYSQALSEAEYDVAFEELLQCIAQREQNELQSYLQREERILTLARQKESKMQKSFSLADNLFAAVKGAKMQGHRNSVKSYLCRLVSEHVLKPAAAELVKVMKEGYCERALESSEAFLSFKKLLWPEIKMEVSLEGYEEEIIKSVSYSKSKPYPCVAVKLTLNENSVVICLNKSLHANKRGGAFYLKRDRRKRLVRVGDVDYLSPMAFCVLTDKIFKQHLLEVKTEDQTCKEDMVYMSAIDYLKDYLKPCMLNDVLYVDSSFFTTYPDVKIFLQEILDLHCVFEVTEDATRQKVCLLDEKRIGLFIPFCSGLDHNSLKRNTYHFMEDMYVKVFELLYQDWKTAEKVQRYREEVKHVARACETKKNIPEKYLNAMKNSGFNDYFGYIEIDEDCDLNAVEEIEKEFRAVCTTYFEGLAMRDVALRFRKLGKHRASGLFYPFINCICVDIRNPASMIHEYFHMLDYNFGECSRKYSFLQVFDRYSELIKQAAENLDEKDPVKGVLFGNSKYNMDYYLTPTEVFARCGEIYMRHTKGLFNSLSGSVAGIEYPTGDKILLEYVKDYFDHFFDKIFNLSKGGKKEADKAA